MKIAGLLVSATLFTSIHSTPALGATLSCIGTSNAGTQITDADRQDGKISVVLEDEGGGLHKRQTRVLSRKKTGDCDACYTTLVETIPPTFHYTFKFVVTESLSAKNEMYRMEESFQIGNSGRWHGPRTAVCIKH